MTATSLLSLPFVTIDDDSVYTLGLLNTVVNDLPFVTIATIEFVLSVCTL